MVMVAVICTNCFRTYGHRSRDDGSRNRGTMSCEGLCGACKNEKKEIMNYLLGGNEEDDE